MVLVDIVHMFSRRALRHGERCKPPQPVRGRFSPFEYVTRALVIPGRVKTRYTAKTRTDLAWGPGIWAMTHNALHINFGCRKPKQVTREPSAQGNPPYPLALAAGPSVPTLTLGSQI